MKYWNSNRKSCEHVEPREDWKESIELWIDWMEAIGRTEETLRTRWYQIVRFSKIVNKSITDVTEDNLIFYLAGMGTDIRGVCPRRRKASGRTTCPSDHQSWIRNHRSDRFSCSHYPPA